MGFNLIRLKKKLNNTTYIYSYFYYINFSFEFEKLNKLCSIIRLVFRPKNELMFHPLGYSFQLARKPTKQQKNKKKFQQLVPHSSQHYLIYLNYQMN
jgi:hypothetical protein